MYIAAVACASLYVLWVIACWRIADYFCVKWRWLLLVPIINLLYFSKLSDVVAVEAHDSKQSYSVWVMLVTLVGLTVSACLYQFKQNELLLLFSEIGIILSGIFAMLTFCWCYMTYIQNSFEFPSLVCLLSIIIPFPVWMFIASFTIQGKTAEVIELYLG